MLDRIHIEHGLGLGKCLLEDGAYACSHLPCCPSFAEREVDVGCASSLGTLQGARHLDLELLHAFEAELAAEAVDRRDRAVGSLCELLDRIVRKARSEAEDRMCQLLLCRREAFCLPHLLHDIHVPLLSPQKKSIRKCQPVPWASAFRRKEVSFCAQNLEDAPLIPYA